MLLKMGQQVKGFFSNRLFCYNHVMPSALG